VNGHSILKHNNSQDAVVHLRDFGPEAAASIALHGGFFGAASVRVSVDRIEREAKRNFEFWIMDFEL